MARYNWLVVVVLFAALMGGSLALQTTSASAEDGTPIDGVVADQSFKTIDGKDISLYQFKGKTVLVHFWGTWCPPCVKELPGLLDAVEKNPDSVLIAVSLEHNKDMITNFLKRINHAKIANNVHFIMDPGAQIVIGDRPVDRYPTTIILTPKMTLADRVNSGIDWDGYSF